MVMSVMQKLNSKGHDPLVFIGAPSEFEVHLRDVDGPVVLREFPAGESATFAMAFGTTLAELKAFADLVAAHTSGDTVLWFGYPKGSSRRYTCEFTRDNGWAALGTVGLEPVRQVAIDDDWTALRFRRTEFIPTMTRATAHAQSAHGRHRTQGNQPPTQ